MKKAVVCWLVTALLMSLMACGSTDPVEGVDQEITMSQQEDVGGENEATTEQSQETTAAEAPETEGTTEAPLFDNSWASNEYEAQLPELPFNWSVGEAHDPAVYLIKVKDVQYTDAKSYGELLSQCGFDMDLWVDDSTEGGNYRVMARNKNGYAIDYDFNAYSYDQPITGLLTIHIEKVE